MGERVSTEELEALRNTREVEKWVIHDTIQIGPHMAGNVTDEGFASYAALATKQDHPLFAAKRKRTTSTPAYNSQDLDGLSSYGMRIYHLGIGLYAPIATSEGEITDPLSGYEGLIFSAELPKHIGVIVKVGQDEKLVTTSLITPSGSGAGGISQIDESPGFQSVEGSQVGVPILANRFHFEEPLLVPRTTIFSVTIILSEYARSVLSAMKGPGSYNFRLANGDPYDPPVARNAIIQGTLEGVRARMLPGALS